MAKLFKWLIVLILPLFSLTFTSCGDDDKDEPTISESEEPDDPDDPVNIEDIIEGTWKSTDDYVDCGVTFKAGGIYYRSEKVSWWEKGDYIIANDKIIFTPISDWTGNEWDMEWSIKYYRFTWQVEYKNGQLIVTDEDGDKFTMSKTQNEPVYAHEIVGKWSITDEDYVETLQFDVSGEYRREVYINQRLYVWQAGTYTLNKGKYVSIMITSSNSGAENQEVVYGYNIGDNGLTLYDYDGEVESYKRVN